MICCLQDQFTNKNTNGTWSNILVGLPHYWNTDPYIASDKSVNTWSADTRIPRGYSVHSHLFRNLEPDTRYEVIVQSQNQFGWSEPTKPFIFSTRYQGNQREYPFRILREINLRARTQTQKSQHFILPAGKTFLSARGPSVHAPARLQRAHATPQNGQFLSKTSIKTS